MSGELKVIPYADLDECHARKDEDGVPFEQWRLMAHVLYHYRRFQSTENPAYAAEAFAEAVRLGFVPPEPLMEWVAESFYEILKTPGGKPDVAKAFGFKGSRGQMSPFQRRGYDFVQFSNLSYMADAIAILDVSVEQAAEMVAHRNEWLFPDDKHQSSTTLIAEYYRKRRERYRAIEDQQREFLAGTGTRSTEVRRNFALQFPDDCIPSDVKKRLSMQ